MQLSRILRPAAVKVLANVSSKKRLFQDLGDIVASVHGLDAGAAFSALQERESLGPTGVGHGVALPHARIKGLEEVVGAFVRIEKPVDFDAVDRQPVDLVFALFAPDGSGVDHLKALALVSRTMRDPAICAKLRANDEPDTLHTILTEAQSTRAA
jgi:nitrogen PTS system EIIA component